MFFLSLWQAERLAGTLPGPPPADSESGTPETRPVIPDENGRENDDVGKRMGLVRAAR